MIDDLYDLIGGRQTVVAATEAFYRRFLADESISHFFKITDMARLRARQSMFCFHAPRWTRRIHGKRYYHRLCAVAEEAVERHSLRCFSQALSRERMK
jgi:truncated hemoglobin YjbI